MVENIGKTKLGEGAIEAAVKLIDCAVNNPNISDMQPRKFAELYLLSMLKDELPKDILEKTEIIITKAREDNEWKVPQPEDHNLNDPVNIVRNKIQEIFGDEVSRRVIVTPQEIEH